MNLRDSKGNAAPLPDHEGVPDDPMHLVLHALPTDTQLLHRPTQWGARLRLLFLLVVCAAPVLASYLTYHYIRPEGRRNTGDLIDPQLPLPALTVKTLQGSAVELQSLRGQWLLIAVVSETCDKQCQDNLYYQRQLRELMGKDSDRLDRVVLLLDDTVLNPGLLPALKEATILRAHSADISAWLQPGPGQRLTDHLYVVDPIGNWMMRFPPNLDLSKTAKSKSDLQRLLRASSFWDQAGRN